MPRRETRFHSDALPPARDVWRRILPNGSSLANETLTECEAKVLHRSSLPPHHDIPFLRLLPFANVACFLYFEVEVFVCFFTHITVGVCPGHVGLYNGWWWKTPPLVPIIC